MRLGLISLILLVRPFHFFVFFTFWLILACSPSSTESVALETLPLKYAKGFTILKGEGFYEIHVNQPWTGAETSFRYLVLPDGFSGVQDDFDAVVSPMPNRLVLTSTTHIPHLDLLKATDLLVGFPDTDLISSPEMRARIDKGLVNDLGSGPSANPELTLELSPDLMIISTLGDDLKYLDLLKSAGIPTVINGEYVEQHPLGRAEWIKFTGLLLGKYEEAVTVFNQIEKDYLATVELGKSIDQLDIPSVISGVMYQDIWYAPGNDSWGANILSQSGGNYVFSENEGTGSIQLNYEYALDKGLDAEYWIGSADFESLVQMGNTEPRYQAFNAFQLGNVFTYTQKKGATGGLEYFELGYMRPDLILKDMIKILHPETLPDYELYFYKRLNEK